MNWISKHSSEHKANLLKYNPVVDHASKGPEQRGKKLQKKILNLSDKHAGLYSSVIEGEGQNKYTSGDYDKDYKKLGKVEDKLERKEQKYQTKFNKSPYAPNMEGPLNNDNKKNKKDSREKRRYLRKFARDVMKDNKSKGAPMTGPLNKEGWIQKATASIKKRGTEGVCTGDKFGSASCPPGSKRYNLAKTFKKMAKNR